MLAILEPAALLYPKYPARVEPNQTRLVSVHGRLVRGRTLNHVPYVVKGDKGKPLGPIKTEPLLSLADGIEASLASEFSSSRQSPALERQALGPPARDSHRLKQKHTASLAPSSSSSPPPV